MILTEKILEVERVFEDLDQEIKHFKNWSGLQCKAGCGKCCLKPDIEATILEFIPFAQYLFTNNLANDWLERHRTTSSSTCMIFNPTLPGVGLCTQYKHRGLICRLFGFSARTTKYQKKEFVTCEVIKTEQVENFILASKKVENQDDDIPVMHNYYMRMHAIDRDLARDFYPINTAIKKAIETVLAYYAYRK